MSKESIQHWDGFHYVNLMMALEQEPDYVRYELTLASTDLCIPDWFEVTVA